MNPLINVNIKNSLIYILDYFGVEFIPNKLIIEFLDRGNIVLLDVTHSILNRKRFKMEHENLYLIASLRKMFPIPDGGITYYTVGKFDRKIFPKGYEKMIEAMALKNLYLELDFAT